MKTRTRKMADENTIRRLWRYKSDLEQELDEEKLIEILGKLKRLTVSISALQETGIGRVINGYRKREGIVGDLARKVVALWKAVVEQEVKTSRQRSPSQSPDNHVSEAEENIEENENDGESDTNSWNSFMEDDENCSNSLRKPGSHSQRKRRHSGNDKNSHKKTYRDSEVDKKDKDTVSKSRHLKVGSSKDDTPEQKKTHKDDGRDKTDNHSHSRHGNSAKVSSLKEDTGRYSSSSQSKSGRHGQDNSCKAITNSHESSSHHRVKERDHRVNEKGDSYSGSIELNRRQKRHSMSSSDEEGHNDDDSDVDDNDDDNLEEACDDNLRDHQNVKSAPPADSQKHSMSSGPHKHSSLSSSRKESSRSHRHPSSHDSSSRSPKDLSSHKKSSSSHRDSPSSHRGSSGSHRGSSSSHKDSSSSHKDSSSSHKGSSGSHKGSSSSHKDSSSSHKDSSSSHKDSSSSHKDLSSSNRDSSSSHKNSSSSHKGLSSSHRPSQSSDSYMQSPLLNTDSQSSPPSSSHRHSNSDRPSSSNSKRQPSADSHKLTPSSDSHKNSHRDPSSAHKHSSVSHKHSSSTSHKHSSPSEEGASPQHNISAGLHPEKDKVRSDAVPSKTQSSSSSRHTSHHDQSRKSESSNSHRQSSSSRSRDQAASEQRNSDQVSRDHETSGRSSKNSKHKDYKTQHSEGKKATVSDTDSSPKESQENLFTSLKETSHSKNNSHGDDRGSKYSSSKKHSENNHEKKYNPTSKQQSLCLSADNLEIKSSSGINVENKFPESSLPGSKSGDKSSSSKHTKVKATSSNHKRSRHKDAYQQPNLDLFSEAIQIKTEPSLPVVKSGSSKQTNVKSTKSSSSLSSAKSAAVLPDDVPLEGVLKSESSVSDHKSDSQVSLKVDIMDDDDDDSDLQQEEEQLKSGKEKKRKKMESPVHDENMSFEDFMNFDEAIVVKKGRAAMKSASKKSSAPSTGGNSGSKQTSGDRVLSAANLPSSSKTGFSVPAPSTNVTVTELDILSMLPETQANYKPLRFNNFYRSDEEREPSPPAQVDPDIIGTKTGTRTNVYSGRKHRATEMRRLYDMCLQVLIDNIDAIDCVGGIPYSILKPVLERCTAQQLYQLEDYNPHFLEDSDELWEILCQRDFRGSTPDEMETWRELYMRRFEERELKYQKLKMSMSSSISKGQAGRKAQLAYVDTVAKPPREVLRKQKQFGTGCIVTTKNNPNMKGSSSGLKAYKPSLLVPAHNPMDDKPRMTKAIPPMLAKSIQMRKNMRR